jgi:hypothetical protein
MVGLAIPYSFFECAATRPKLNAMQFCYGVGSNFITGAPPEFEDLLTLRLCMNPKFNNPNCHISKQGFKQGDLPNQVQNDTSIRLGMMKLRPLLAAENFHNKLCILLEAVIGCRTSSATQCSHNYLQYECCAYHRIAAFNALLNHNRTVVYIGILCCIQVCSHRNCYKKQLLLL